MRRPIWWSLTIAASLLLIAGCADDPSPFTETRLPDQVLQPEEWEAFQRIVDALPAPKLLEMPTVYPPLPNWIETRSLPVYELVAEEQRMLAESWNVEVVLKELVQSKTLKRLLQDEKLSPEQFVGITLTVAAALARAQLEEDYDFADYLRTANEEVTVLQRDRRLYSAMTPDTRHQVLRDAMWLHRVDRITRLSSVPPENVMLVRQHREFLSQNLPKRFQRPPLDDVTDMLAERGLPFVEMSASGYDDHLEWDPAEALGGK
ncbi:MAG TPA: hypothetical protein VFG20_04415 [Planctomycetaceae bacterium]|nr:hypothetical protein [Planctomycetaceae bacterium]